MKRLKPTKKTNLDQKSGSSKDSASVFPCYTCGIIFAKKNDYRQHNEYYHRQKQETPNDRFKCPECPETFGDDEEAYQDHLTYHDLGTLIGVLRRGEMSKKRSHPLIVHAPALDATTSGSAVSVAPFSNDDSAQWDLKDKSLGDAQMTEKAGKSKATPRPRSKSVFTTSTTKTGLQTPTASNKGTPQTGKRRRIQQQAGVPSSPSTPVQSTVAGPLATSSPTVALALPQTSATDAVNASTELKPSLLIPGGPIPAQLPILKPPFYPPAILAAGGKIQAALSSSCPNCGLNLGKPWHLVDHMISQHDAQLIRLHRMLKRPDAGSGMLTSQMFTDRQCCFCQLSFADVQTSLVHIIRTHRSRLFECPDNGECVMTIELSCAIGLEVTPKKFTVSVKVKRKTTE